MFCPIAKVKNNDTQKDGKAPLRCLLSGVFGKLDGTVRIRDRRRRTLRADEPGDVHIYDEAELDDCRKRSKRASHDV